MHFCVRPDYYDHADCFSDAPVFLDYPELDKRFSGAKFIYSWRDPIKWERSFREHFLDFYRMLCDGTLPKDPPKTRLVYDTTKAFIGDNPNIEPDRVISKYWMHRRQAELYFASRSNDFLFLPIDTIANPMELLCRFLDKPVGEYGAFPNINSGGTRAWADIVHPNLVR